MSDIAVRTRVIALVTFVIYSIGCIVIGNLADKKNSSGEFGKTFFAGGGNLSIIPMGLMLAAAASSGSTFLANPGIANSWGLMWVVSEFLWVFSTLVTGMVGSKKLKIVCNRINCVSTGVALKHRYENSTFIAWFAPLSILVFQGLFLYQQVASGAKLMESVTGLPYIWGLVIFGGILLAYTIFSGAKGSSVVSIFQGAVMSIAAFALIFGIYGAVHQVHGSTEAAFRNLAESSPELLHPASKFSFPILVSYFFYMGFSVSIGNDSVAKATKVGTSRNLHSSTFLSVVIVAFWAIALNLLGLVAKMAFPDVPSDTIIPYSALATLPPVLSGIVVAGVAAAIHSTLAFVMLNINSSVVMDLYQGQIKKGSATNKELKTVNTICTCVLVAAMVGFAVKPPALLGIINIFASVGGACAFFVPVLFGLWWKRANKYGCIASMVCGVGYFFAAQRIEALTFGLHAMIPSLIAAMIGMCVVSLLTPPPSDEVLDIWFGVGKSAHQGTNLMKQEI